MLDLLYSPNAWISLATLMVLEVVLGIDNIIFLSLAANKLDAPRRPTARRIGLSLALILRIIFLSSIAWIISLSKPIVTVWGIDFSWKDIVFFAGGLFLLVTSVSISACNTVAGAGKDVSGAGKAVTNTADDAKKN
ncbi:MAG: entericidin A/B family lipoprotein [Rhizomicrobium sp.]